MTKVKQKSNTVIDKLTCHFYRLRGGGRGILFVSRCNLPAPPIGFRKVPIIPSPPHWHFIGSQFSIVFLYTLLATTDLSSLSFWEPWYSSAQKNPSPPQAIKTTLPWGKFFKGFDVATNDKKFPRTIKVCRFCASLIENVLILWIPASHVSRVETGHLLTKVNFIFLPLSSKREIIIWCALASSNVSICNVGCYFNSCLWQPFYRDWYFQILQIFNCEVQQ